MLSNRLKNIINIIFLALSCVMSIYFLTQLSSNIMVRVIIIVFVIVYEITMQYVLSLGRAKWRQGGPAILTALLYFFFYSIYVFIYALPSALGFFVAEIAVQEEAAAAVAMEKSIVKDQLAINQETIRALNRQLETEARTGYGPRSQEIMEKLTELRMEQIELQRKLFGSSGGESLQSSKETLKTSSNAFKSLAEVLKSFVPITENLLKFIVFGTSILMLYLGLILTNWDIGEVLNDRDNRAAEVNKGHEKVWPKEKGRKKTTKENQKSFVAESSNESSQKSSTESFSKSSVQSYPESFPKSSLQKVLSDSAQVPKKVPKSDTKFDTEFERFLRATIRETGILNSPRRVHMLTGIPLDRCVEYRKRLDEMRIGDTPIVETVQGGSRANFEKEVILERVRGREAI